MVTNDRVSFKLFVWVDCSYGKRLLIRLHYEQIIYYFCRIVVAKSYYCQQFGVD